MTRAFLSGFPLSASKTDPLTPYRWTLWQPDKIATNAHEAIRSLIGVIINPFIKYTLSCDETTNCFVTVVRISGETHLRLLLE